MQRGPCGVWFCAKGSKEDGGIRVRRGIWAVGWIREYTGARTKAQRPAGGSGRVAGRSPRPCGSNGERREEGGGANWRGLANRVVCGAIDDPTGEAGDGETTCSAGSIGDFKWKCSGLICGPELQGGESGIIHTRSANKDKSPPQAGTTA